MSRAPLAVALLVAGAACSRTKHVREPQQPAEAAAPEAGRGAGGGIPAAPGRPRVPAAPGGLLREGVVGEIQRALAGRGLLRDHRAGVLDDPTSAAIQRFQHERGLAATGFPDRETLKDLGIDPEHAYVREEDRRREEGKEGGGGRRDRSEAGAGAGSR